MRIASGWYYERIPSWLKEIETGQRLMWFIYLSDPMSQVLATAANSAGSTTNSPLTSTSGSSNQSGFQSYPPVGMVCLSLYNQEDPSLASFSQTGRTEICSLFVYAAYRPLGVGVAAIQNMERRAQMMGAVFVTLNTPAVERPLRKYTSMGYREYKSRSRAYSISDVRNAGLPEEYEVAAFLEKSLT
jgi:ribosomal protein S18 acetylase RimI-like enzyme